MPRWSEQEIAGMVFEASMRFDRILQDPRGTQDQRDWGTDQIVEIFHAVNRGGDVPSGDAVNALQPPPPPGPRAAVVVQVLRGFLDELGRHAREQDQRTWARLNGPEALPSQHPQTSNMAPPAINGTMLSGYAPIPLSTMTNSGSMASSPLPSIHGTEKKGKSRAGKKVLYNELLGLQGAYAGARKYGQAKKAGLPHAVALRLSRTSGSITDIIEAMTNPQRPQHPSSAPPQAFVAGFPHVSPRMIQEHRDELNYHHLSLTPDQRRNGLKPCLFEDYTTLSFEHVFGDL